MEEINILSTCLIKQASPNSNIISNLDLTPWDLQFLFLEPVQKGILFRKPDLENPFIIDHLKTSLARALDLFPPLAGRLLKTINDDNTTVFSVNCNNAGALFTHATCHEICIRDILDPIHMPPIIRLFFPLNGLLNIEGQINPLLGVQITELRDGFFIACAMSHCVVDGTSFWHFFNTWGEIYRDFTNITCTPPAFVRSGFTKIHVPDHFEKNLSNEIISPPQLLERVFHFSKENLVNLKRKANFEAKTDKISSLQSMLAHLWRGITRCRSLKADEEVSCILLIGTRTRLPLPDTYFGNAVYITSSSAKNGDLLGNGLGWAALELNKTVSFQTREEAKRMLEDSLKNPQIITKKEWIMHRNKFAVSSSPRHKVYETDFGWGKAVAVRSGGAQKSDGKITVFPAVVEGGIDVEVCLVPETMLALGEDAEFMEVFN